MASPSPPRDRRGFEIALICALRVEADCVQATFDKFWGDEGKRYGQSSRDENSYTTGMIGEHNVVLAYMPNIGKVGASGVAASLRFSFPEIRLALVVGICGGVPFGTNKEEILLGDIIISRALVQYDFGRQYAEGFEEKDTLEDNLGRPSQRIRGFLTKLQTYHYRSRVQNGISLYLKELQQKLPKVKYPGAEADKLYEPSYLHKHHKPVMPCDECAKGEIQICQAARGMTCEELGCEEQKVVVRSRLAKAQNPQQADHPEQHEPMVHFGRMGSGDTVMKWAERRDKIAKTKGIIAFEMEGAGVWDHFPSIVIKGVCDYADSHKNDQWHDYAASTAAACMKAFLKEWVAEDRFPKQERAPKARTYSVIPQARLKNFIGREDELQKILSFFSTSETADPRILVLHALGGQGKSQIALKFCKLARTTYRGIFWVNASSERAAIQSFVVFAQEIDRTVTAALSDDEDRVRFVLRNLEQWSERWMLVFDNYDDPESFPDILRFIPSVGHGDVLITTRHQSLEQLGTVIEVPPMPTDEAVKLLLRGYSETNIDPYKPQASEIITRLGALALAIDQAASYTQYIQLPIQRLGEFLPTYEAQKAKILQHTREHFWEYGAIRVVDEVERPQAISAFTTWEMSFQQLYRNDDKRRDAAAHFLTLSAFLGPTNISESLFQYHWQLEHPQWMDVFEASTDTDSDNGISSSDEELVEGEPESSPSGSTTLQEGIRQPGTSETSRPRWNADHFWHLINQAYGLSLLQNISRGVDQEETTLAMHPLIRDWLQLREKQRQRQTYTREGMDLVASSIKVYKIVETTANLKNSLLLHLNACLRNDQQFFRKGHNLGQKVASCTTAMSFSSFYRTMGLFPVSETLATITMNTMTKGLGKKHPDTLTSMANLASTYRNQGRWKEAEELEVQVMETRKRVLGQEHPDTLTSMNSLALTYLDQGRWKEAEELGVQVMETRKRVLGQEHPSTLASMSNLASAYRNQGRWKEAEELNVQVMKTSLRVLGQEHPFTLTSMANLASTYRNQGRWKEAEELEVQVMEMSLKMLGQEHLDTLASMNNLALTYQNQGRWKEAEELEVQVMEMRKRVLGQEHPDMLTSMNNLASTYLNQGRWKEAEELGVQVMETRKRVLGQEHPDMLASMNNLASVYRNQGRWKEAEELNVQVMKTSLRVLGQEHPFTLISMTNLASTFWNQGRWKEAEELDVQAMETRKRVLGQEHPDTLASMNNLASTFWNQGRWKEAEELDVQVMETSLRALGQEHPSTLASMNNLAQVLNDQGKYEQSKKLQVQVFQMSVRILGPQHPQTLTTLKNLLSILVSQSREEEALDFVKHLLDNMGLHTNQSDADSERPEMSLG